MTKADFSSPFPAGHIILFSEITLVFFLCFAYGSEFCMFSTWKLVEAIHIMSVKRGG